MKLPIFIFLIGYSSICLGQSIQKQIYGTHAFIDLPASFSYSYDPSGFIDSKSNILISGFRAPENIESVKKQFDTPQYPCKIATGFNAKNTVIQMDINKNNKIVTNFMTTIGDNKESAIITISVTDVDKNIELVKSLINSIRWKGDCDLNFEKAFFFKINGLKKFQIMSKMNNNFIFTPNNLPLQHPKFTLTIGTNVILANSEGREKEIIDYLINPKNEKFQTISKEYSNLIIDNKQSITVKWKYRKNLEVVNQYFTAIFSEGRFYFIEEKSLDLEYDNYFEDYDKMIKSFQLTSKF